MGLSAKIKGLRFMQRAMDKADVEKKPETGSEAGTGGGNSEGDRGTADWVAEASTRSCVVLRGAGAGRATGRGRGRGGGSQAKGRLKFGGKVEVGGVELNEQERVVAEQVLGGAAAGSKSEKREEKRKGDDSSSQPKKKKRKNEV